MKSFNITFPTRAQLARPVQQTPQSTSELCDKDLARMQRLLILQH